MVLVLFNTLTNKDKTDAIERLIRGSTPRQDFFLMIILSILTATFGLLLGNTAIIIGSMLIAPMLYPLLSLSLGIIMSDSKLMTRSFYTILKSMAYAIVSAAAVTLLFSSQFTNLTPLIFSMTQATLPYVVVAIIAGMAGSFALVKPHLNETLPGIAISVSLIPPLAVVGIGLARFNWAIISGSLLLFLVNAVGVMFASMITFSLMNFYVKRTEAAETVKKEDAKVERDNKRAEKAKENGK
ncbi:MAG: TIGR00341 family protein [Patescibacteria group bacterium]